MAHHIDNAEVVALLDDNKSDGFVSGKDKGHLAMDKEVDIVNLVILQVGVLVLHEEVGSKSGHYPEDEALVAVLEEEDVLVPLLIDIY